MKCDNVLIAASDTAFVSVLAEQLAALSGCRTTVVDNGNALLEKIVTQPFDLLIVDVTLQDPSLPELLTRVHALRPSLRIMVIPYPGNKVPPTLKDIPAHGLLPKPFMTDELPLLIRRVLRAEAALPVGQMADLYDPETNVTEEVDLFALFSEDGSVSIASFPDSDHLGIAQTQNIDTAQSETGSQEIAISPEEATSVLRSLERELQAVLVVLSCNANLLAHTGSLPRNRVEDFCRFVARRVESGTQMMRFLDANDGNITMSLDEGGKYRVYTTQVTPTVRLTVALELRVPVGSLRYHIRRAVEQLTGPSLKE